MVCAVAVSSAMPDWDVTGMVRMFDNAGLSTDNYDAILFGWS
jgi:hypothetical protein